MQIETLALETPANPQVSLWTILSSYFVIGLTAFGMAQKMNAFILGVIENMARLTAPDTGKHYEIFGPSHAAEVSEAAGAPLLTRVPLDPQFAERCDAGEIKTLPTEALNACVAALTVEQTAQIEA